MCAKKNTVNNELFRLFSPGNDTKVLVGEDINQIADLDKEKQLCVIFNNKYGYRRLFKGKGLSKDGVFSLSRVLKMLSQSGFNHFKTYVINHSLENIVSISEKGTNVLSESGISGKRLLKAKLINSSLFFYFQPAYLIVAAKASEQLESCLEMVMRDNNIECDHRFILGKPHALIVVAKKMVVRVPLDRLSILRCRQNKRVLTQLKKTSISSFTPGFLQNIEFQGKQFFCEGLVPGVSIDPSHKDIKNRVFAAIDFITEFQLTTAKDITLNQGGIKRFFLRELERLIRHVDDLYKEKLSRIGKMLEERLMGKQIKSVWFHGDYKIENILFNARNAKIEGIIDWDLSRQQGLPLLDIFYLLIYNESFLKHRSVLMILRDRFVSGDFTVGGKEIIENYMQRLELDKEMMLPLQIMFFLQHVVQRYGQTFTDNPPHKEHWLKQEVYSCIDAILEAIG
ncbi:MAG: aminoglycoside phosphotransferase family protein [PVC group bacterium]|nr:aminoglycoside phosphotransferase family protein [PVC group bacterium]